MKYHLDTIPVWDAFHEETECPLCTLHDKSEQSYVDFFLGGSVMEPDTRIELNRTGFCPHHFSLLYKVQNRLGLALITHTHLKETKKEFAKQASALNHAGPNTSSLSDLFKKKSGESKSKVQLLAAKLLRKRDSCAICSRIDNSMERYTYTILHLWDNDQEFRKTFLASKGFCLPHLAAILQMSEKTLSAKKRSEFISDIIPIETASLDKLESELEWFTLKFDYRNQDKPWGNSKDALPRTLQKLMGRKME